MNTKKLMTIIKKNKIFALLLLYTTIIPPLQQFTWGPDVIALIAALIIISYFLKIIIAHKKIKIINIHIATIIFISFSLIISLLYNSEGIPKILEFVTWRSNAFLIQALLIMIVAYNIIKSRKKIKLISQSYVLGAFITALPIINGKIWGAKERALGLLQNENAFGLTLVFAVFLIFLLLQNNKNKFSRRIYYFLFLLFSSGIILSGSRTAIAMLIIFLLLFFIRFIYKNLIRSYPKAIIIILMFVITLSGIIILYSSTEAFSRNIRFINAVKNNQLTNQESTVAGRISFYKASWYTFLEHPIIGVGPGRFRFFTDKYVPGLREAYSHSNYMELLSCFGLLGFILYYIIYYLIIKRAIWISKKYPYLKNIAQIIIIALCIQLIAEIAWVSLYQQFMWLILTIYILWLKLGKNTSI